MSETDTPFRRRMVLVALWLAVAGLVWLFDAGVQQEARTKLADDALDVTASPRR